jgi:hypothetical protein
MPRWHYLASDIGEPFWEEIAATETKEEGAEPAAINQNHEELLSNF